MSNFMKIPPVVAELFHADRPTNMVKLVDAFPNFPNEFIKVTILLAHLVFGGGGSCGGYCTFNP